jgi:hypothetical protein
MLNAALFGAIAAGQSSAPPAATLPEDEPLPAATATLNATTATFDSVYASAAAGNHIVLANGSYGTKTLSRTFPSGNRLVIRAQNPLGATFTSLTISGSGQIISGVNIDLGSTNDTGRTCGMNASNVRLTRCKLSNGARSVSFGAGVTDILIDHCDRSRTRLTMFDLADPKDQLRITVARCWCHDLVGLSTNSQSHCFGWAGENVYREKHENIIVRFTHCGPGLASSVTPSSDWIHHKGSKAIYAFNHCETGAGGIIANRFGLRNRYVGNYMAGINFHAWDDLAWYYGNIVGELRCPIGRSQYFDDTKNLAGSPNNSVGGFHANKRTRISGNNGTIALGWIPDGTTWCTNTSPDPATLPDPLACGGIKELRTFSGITYAADDPSHPDVGVKIRAHTGTITNSGSGSGGACGASFPWVQNLSNLPSNAAPGNWQSELFDEYPWIQDICPNPTSLTGGPGGSAPWSVAQALTRGNAANPNTGPSRNSPGGLP